MNFVALLIVLVMFVLAVSIALIGCGDRSPSFIIEGEVVAVGSRLVRDRNLTEEAFAISLKPNRLSPELRETLGRDPIVFECHSTRCSVLKPQDQARFVCEMSRWTDSPNVVVCRFDRFL